MAFAVGCASPGSAGRPDASPSLLYLCIRRHQGDVINNTSAPYFNGGFRPAFVHVGTVRHCRSQRSVEFALK